MADPGNEGPWECRTPGVVGMADPGNGGPWEWRTLGVVSRYHEEDRRKHRQQATDTASRNNTLPFCNSPFTLILAYPRHGSHIKLRY